MFAMMTTEDLSMEDYVDRIPNYLQGLTINDSDAKVARAIKLRARSFLLHEDMVYRRIENGLHLVTHIEKRIDTLRTMRDDIGQAGFGGPK